MFTGIIEEIGTIKSIQSNGLSRKITVQAGKIFNDLKIDDSVSVNGVCQTVTEIKDNSFSFISVEETIRKTNFLKLSAGRKVNLERALTLNTRLGGHLVQGHVDCTGTVNSIQKENAAVNLWISYPSEFNKFLVNTGSITINGISLTSAKVESVRFLVSIIPHTWQNTVLYETKIGDLVNLEFDILGKYIDKLLNKNIDTSFLNSLIDQPY